MSEKSETSGAGMFKSVFIEGTVVFITVSNRNENLRLVDLR